MNAAAQQSKAARAGLFGVFGGPLAWYVQLCAGYALASKPCFRGGQLTAAPGTDLSWSSSAMVVVILAAVLVSLAALGTSWRSYRRSSTTAPGDAHHAMEAGTGRARFLALWGMVLNAGFALAASTSAIVLLAVPRCAG